MTCTCGESRYGYPHTKDCPEHPSNQRRGDVRSWLEETFPEDADLVHMDGYDEAIIGVAVASHGTGMNCKMVYDLAKVVEINMRDGRSHEEAVEFYEVEQGGAYVGEHTPIFVKVFRE